MEELRDRPPGSQGLLDRVLEDFESLERTPHMPSAGRLPGLFWAVLLIGGVAYAAENSAERPPEGAAPAIRKVAFEGRRWLPRELFLEVSGLEPGSRLLPGATVEACRRLQRHPRVELTGRPRIRWTPDGRVDLTFPVKELPVVGEISFSGQSALRTGDLLAAVPLESGEPLKPTVLESARHAIVTRYHRDGFLFVDVRVTVEPLGAGRQRVSFAIDEGDRVHVREVSLEGAEQLPASKSLSFLKLRPRILFGLLSRGYYVPEDMAEDLERLRAAYISYGFLSAEVGMSSLELSRDYRSISVHLWVREGPRYIVGAVRVEGSDIFSPEVLERAAALKTGVAYSGQAVEEAIHRVHRWYETRSDRLPRIRVESEYEETGNRITLVIQVRDERFFETGEVRVQGNRITRDRVIRKEVGLVPGMPFSETELESTRERIERTGFFRNVEIEASERPPDPGDPETQVVDVEILVDEKDRSDEARSFVEVGGGASRGAGEVAYVSVHRRNFDLFRLPRSWDDWDAFKGGGQYLNFEFIPGTRESYYNFRFEEPYLFRSDLALSVKGGVSLLDREDHEESHILGRVEVRKSFDRDGHLTAALAYVGDNARIHDLDSDASPDAVEARGSTFVSYPRLELRYDPRERNFYSGYSGFRARARVDLASDILGSETEFSRVSATADYHIPLFDERPDYRHILHLGLNLSWMEGLDGDSVPLFERFYLGGAWSFRGFEYRRLGPHQGDSPVGGEGAIHGTVDYSFPLVWREIRGFAVFEWGDLESGFSDIAANRFRTAVGGGVLVRMKLLGQTVPANFYWVQALRSQRQDKEQLFQFTVGIDF